MSEITEALKAQVSDVNLAEGMDDERLTSIASDLVTGFDSDEMSRSDWLRKSEDYLKLALQIKEQKNTPWPNSANVKFPLLSISSIHFNARMYPALVNGFDIVRGMTVGRDEDGQKADQARRVSKHMSYQLLHEMEDWEDDMDAGLFILPMIGTFFKKVYYDPIDEINKSELVMPQDLSINFYSKSMKKAPRVTHILTQSTNEIREAMNQGLYHDIGLFDEPIEEDDSLTAPTGVSVTPELGVMGNTHIDDVQGITQPSEVDNTVPHEILEMHCWLDLDHDYYEEPYIVTIHRETKKILRIIARYTAEDVVSDEADELLKIKATEYFVNYKFIPDPQSGVYGVGFGTLLGPINETVNTLINQLLDSGTLSNMQSGWIAPGVKVRGGVFKFKPGEWKLAQFVGDNIKNKIMPLPVREPSNTLFALLGMLTTEAQKLSSVMDIMTGEMPGQNTKATVVLQAVEQGSKVFNAIAKRLYRMFSKELKMLFRLNSIHLTDEVYFNVLDKKKSEVIKTAAEDYDLESLNIMPSADPSVSSQSQRIAKVQALEPLVGQGLVNPKVYAKRFVDAVEIEDADELLEMPEPQPNEEFELEKAMAIQEAKNEAAKTDILRQAAVSKAAKEQVESMKILAEIQGMLENNELAQAQQIIDARQQQFSNQKDVAQMQLDKEQGDKEATQSTEE